ncbi:hypothetical protein PGTUg99_033389 [Puccinia graminis f. sp. tritici]|uniref:Uncharacterized protein n=2 Tax=Puccinia graminis f. sp. tritici TaxID=56615 RepID=A0A5B0Q8F6_PUCGR|nr:hypothetical protein PGTUg99_033389 [Puccinia graminis f. sp. tritici]
MFNVYSLRMCQPSPILEKKLHPLVFLYHLCVWDLNAPWLASMCVYKNVLKLQGEIQDSGMSHALTCFMCGE